MNSKFYCMCGSAVFNIIPKNGDVTGLLICRYVCIRCGTAYINEMNLSEEKSTFYSEISRRFN